MRDGDDWCKVQNGAHTQNGSVCGWLRAYSLTAGTGSGHV